MGEGLDGMEGKQGQPGPGHHSADLGGPAYADQAIPETSRAGDASRGLEQITETEELGQGQGREDREPQEQRGDPEESLGRVRDPSRSPADQADTSRVTVDEDL